MAKINMRDHYPFYQRDEYVEVSEELATEMSQWERAEKAYARKQRWHHAHYSLDFANDMERHILFVSDSPDAHFEKRCAWSNFMRRSLLCQISRQNVSMPTTFWDLTRRRLHVPRR